MRKQLRFFSVSLITTILVVVAFLGALVENAALLRSVLAQQTPSDPVTHFTYPPTFDSGWVDIKDKLGQSFAITHDLSTTDAFVDVVGRRRLTSGDHKLFYGSTFYIPGWNKTYNPYGGPNWGESVIQTSDGGYAIAGYTGTPGFPVKALLIKTDSAGTTVWNKTYESASPAPLISPAFSVVQTNDGGYALAGCTPSTDGSSSWDFWLIKTNANGDHEWNYTYGGTLDDEAFCVIQTDDGGYALAGYRENETAYDIDFWLVKTDESGKELWNETYGGTDWDQAYSVVQTDDGGYALAGYTSSPEVGSGFCLVKTNATGIMQWNETYGGERAYSVVQTDDGGYALAGYNWSSTSSDDFWLVKTNEFGKAQWNRTYGGSYSEVAHSMVQTEDGGYAIAGTFEGADPSDYLLVKTDLYGNLQWNRTYGRTDADECNSVIQTEDGGYVLAGYSLSGDPLREETWLIKTDVADLVQEGLSIGLSMVDFNESTITFCRGRDDPYWNYIRVRIWAIKEPTWQYGDIDMDGSVNDGDLFILARNYWKTGLPGSFQMQPTANIQMATIALLAVVAATLGLNRVRKKQKP